MRGAGYTLTELVLVLAIAGILAAFAAPRFFGTSPFQARGYSDELAGAFRYAQKVAVASGCRVRLQVTADGYALAQQAAAGNACNPSDTTWPTVVLYPDGTAATGSRPTDVTVSVTGDWIFNPRGSLDGAAAASVAVGGRTLVVDTGSGLVVVQ